METELKNIEEVEKVEEETKKVVMSEEEKESFMQMLMKTKQIYNTVLQEYFAQPAVVRLIYMENRFRPLTKEIKSIEELKEFMAKEIEMMKSKQNMTNIEKIEFRLAKKIYRDVVDGKGNEFDIMKPLSYNYDGQIKEFDDIKMGNEDVYAEFESYLNQAADKMKK